MDSLIRLFIFPYGLDYELAMQLIKSYYRLSVSREKKNLCKHIKSRVFSLYLLIFRIKFHCFLINNHIIRKT